MWLLGGGSCILSLPERREPSARALRSNIRKWRHQSLVAVSVASYCCCALLGNMFKKRWWCRGRDLNPGHGLERPAYLAGLYYRGSPSVRPLAAAPVALGPPPLRGLCGLPGVSFYQLCCQCIESFIRCRLKGWVVHGCGGRLAWTRTPACQAGGPGFKSRPPHHTHPPILRRWSSPRNILC